MFKFEKKFIELIEKNKTAIFIIIISILALLMRIVFIELRSNDYLAFLSKWFMYIKDNGKFMALKSYPGNYNVPYMIILAIGTYLPFSALHYIKYISIIFDFFLAFVSSRLIREITKGKKEYLECLTYAIILFMPNVILNSSAWAQCDSIYTSFVILSILLLLKKKYSLSFVSLGVAFAFKLQFIFVLPIYIIYYFRKKEFSILNFLLIPITNIILCLPAIIIGKPLWECFTVYYGQTQEYSDHLVLNFPNLYHIINGNTYYLYPFGIILTFTICVIVLFYCIYKKISFNTEKLLHLTLWFIVIITFILPGMHERYLYIGEVLSVILLILYKKPIWLTVYINLIAIITYTTYLFSKAPPSMWYLSFVYIFMIVQYSIQVFKVLNE